MSINTTKLQHAEYNAIKCLNQGSGHYSSRSEITLKTCFQHFRIEDDLSEEMQLLTAIDLLHYNNKYCFIYYCFASFGEIFCSCNNEPIRVDRGENNSRSLDAEAISLSQYCPVS